MVHPCFASTVVLLRPDAAGGFEVLLTRRPPEMRFLGGFYVFPGGTVHPGDYSPDMLARCQGLDGVQARNILGGVHAPDLALGHWVAVVRELFEEVGVLLCAAESGAMIDLREETARKRIESKRRAVVRKRSSFASFLESEEFFCDLTRVAYLDHWVTPEIYSMRFDTRFFVAALPAYQTSLARSEEVTHSVWIEPAAALARIDRRDFPILPPTTVVLERLARIGSWQRLCEKYDLQ